MKLTEEQMFDISEGIARGDGCDSCGAAWVNGELLHAHDCLYFQQLGEEDD